MKVTSPFAVKNMPLVIGNVRLRNNLIMAPMAGITDIPFRRLAKKGGAGLVCSEMISARALTYGDAKTRTLLTVDAGEHPVSVQIFGAQAREMAEAARIVEGAGADIVDINFGCPVRKIVKAGAGVKVVDNEQGLVRIMAEVVRSVKIPVTIKIRIGRTPEENIAPRVVQLAKENGIAFATVHGRPASAGHGGAPNLAAVRETVDAGALQIAGNGGVTDELSAREFLETTGCDALMIGRAAIGDPRIFGRIEKYLSSGEMPPRAPWEERIGFLKEHAALAAEHYGEKHGIVLLRKVAPFYLKGLPNASRIRNEFNRITTLREVNLLIDSIWESPYFGEEASNE